MPRELLWERLVREKYKVGRLTVLRFARKTRGKYFVMAGCECGREIPIQVSNIMGGRQLSCGCYRREWKDAGADKRLEF